MPVVRLSPETGERELVTMRWGLVPGFVDDPSDVSDLVHARAETIDEKPMWQGAFRERRCLMPADSFPVWDPDGRRHTIRHRDPDRILAFAAVWERWSPPEHRGDRDAIESCAMVTVPAGDPVARFQERMPVILEPGAFESWLSPDTPLHEAKKLLRTYPGEHLVVRP